MKYRKSLLKMNVLMTIICTLDIIGCSNKESHAKIENPMMNNENNGQFKQLQVPIVDLSMFPSIYKMITKVVIQNDTLSYAPENPIYFSAIIKKDSIKIDYFDIEITPHSYDSNSNFIMYNDENEISLEMTCMTYIDTIPIIMHCDKYFMKNVKVDNDEIQDTKINSLKLFVRMKRHEPVCVDGCPPSWNCRFNKDSLEWIRMYNGFTWLDFIPRKNFAKVSKMINDTIQKDIKRYTLEHGEAPTWEGITANDYIAIMPE